MDRKLREEIATLHANLCSALAHPHRLLIVCMLAEGARNVGDITAELDIAQSSVSRHLKILEEKGIVFSQRHGQYIEYRLSDARIISALEILRAVVSDMLKEQVALAHTLKDSYSSVRDLSGN